MDELVPDVQDPGGSLLPKKWPDDLDAVVEVRGEPGNPGDSLHSHLKPHEVNSVCLLRRQRPQLALHSSCLLPLFLSKIC